MSSFHPRDFGRSRFAVACALVLVATAPAGAASLTLSATSTHPRGAITVAGAGFGAAEAVDIYFDTIDTALAVTSTAKSFTAVRLAIGGSAEPGPHWITAVGRKSGIVARRSFTVRTEWRQLRFGAAGTGVNPWENRLDSASAPRLGALWRAKVGTSISAPPVAAGGLIHAASTDGVLVAVNADTGGMKWSKTGLGSFAGSPVAVGGRVVVAATDGNVRAFTANTGAVAWTKKLSFAISANPVLSGTRLLISQDAGVLTVLDSASGTQAWSIGHSSGFPGTPAADDASIYFGRLDGRLMAVDSSNGSDRWGYIGGIPFGAVVPAVANGRMVVAAGKTLMCVDTDGHWLWQTTFSSDLGSAAVRGDDIFVGQTATPTIKGQLHAIDVTTGDAKWSKPLGFATRVSPPVLAGDMVVIGGNDRMVRAFTTEGVAKWSAMAAGSGTVSPIVVDGKVVVATGDGWLKAYALDAGMGMIAAQARAAVPPAVETLRPDPALAPAR